MTVEHSFSTEQLPECQPVVKCAAVAVRCVSCIACLKCNVLNSILLRVRGGTVVLHWRSSYGQLFQRWVTAALLLPFALSPCASCGLVSTKGVWCIWPSCSGGLSCGCSLFGFLLHAQISSYLHWALAFPGSWLIHWVFAYVSVWTGTLFRVPDSLRSEWFSSVPGAIVYFFFFNLWYSHLNLYLIS